MYWRGLSPPIWLKWPIQLPSLKLSQLLLISCGGNSDGVSGESVDSNENGGSAMIVVAIVVSLA